jgi:hypothetical protein
MCPNNIGHIKVLGENKNSRMTRKKLAKNGINTTQSIAIHFNAVAMKRLPSLINTIYLTKVVVRWLHVSSSMLAMILIRVKFYIAIGFLSTILHVVPRIQVVKTNYETSVCNQQNIVRMEACTYRQHHIKQ